MRDILEIIRTYDSYGIYKNSKGEYFIGIHGKPLKNTRYSEYLPNIERQFEAIIKRLK